MNDGLISERDLVMGVARASVSECKSETVISNAFTELAAAIRRMGRGRNNNDVAQDGGPDKGRVAPAASDAAPTSNLPHRMQIGRAHVELQSLMRISYAVFCLKKNKT